MDGTEKLRKKHTSKTTLKVRAGSVKENAKGKRLV